MVISGSSFRRLVSMNMDSRFRGNDGKKAEFVLMNMDSRFRGNDGKKSGIRSDEHGFPLSQE